MSEEKACAGTHYGNCKLQISSCMLLPKNYENWFNNKKVIAKIKGYSFV